MEATWSPFSKADDERLLKEVQSRLAANLAGAEKARLWIEVGRVHERRNDSSGARQAYLKSIEADSRTVTGRLQLANVVRLAATTWADLDEAERVLKEASRIAQERKFRPPFLDADETEDTIVLHDVLLLLLCQRGEERADEATKILQQRGYTHRLSTHTLCYQKPERGPWAIDIPYVKAVDNALPASMLAHMQIAYDPAASFWSEHNYSQVTPYFSYIHPLHTTTGAQTSIDQVIAWVHAIACLLFPAVREATKAEWWAHCRPHGSGHQLHFDSDNEGKSREKGRPRHPIASTVLYLSEGVGGPTLVTDQRLGDPLASNGWLVFPKANRLVVFDGTVLHGVLPGRGLPDDPSQRRTTFMIAFWKDVQAHPDPNEVPGSSRPFPDVSRTRFTWPKSFPVGPVGWTKMPTSAEDIQRVVPVPVESVWDRVPSSNTGKRPKPDDVLPRYEDCFQGF